MQYTGERKLLGIAAMHKSNLVYVLQKMARKIWQMKDGENISWQCTLLQLAHQTTLQEVLKMFVD